jgi:hypothetical protein
MKVSVSGTVSKASHYDNVPHGEYDADPGEITDANGRQDHGIILMAGRKEYEVQMYDWNRAIKSGAITEIKEEDTMSANLPAVKVENAVVTVSPQEQINQASDMARLLKEVVSKAGLARKLGGRKEHLEYEAWATIARWFHCTPSTEWTRPIKQDDKIIGWEARVNILDETGRVIGSSEGMCMSDEANWRNKPTYALRSMAQTRTAGKALRSLFAHIAVLAGYSPTPAEEMDGVLTQDDGLRHAEPTPTPPSEPSKPADSATDKQKKALFAKANAKFGDRETALAFITWCKGAAEYWTKEMASGLMDDFDAQAELFTDSQRAA